MKCPACKKGETSVIDSRESEDVLSIRRRRECEKCNHRFTTYERIESPNLLVVKKDGSRETFDRDKLARGVYKAFEKLSISQNVIESLVDKIVREIMEQYDSEVTSQQVGEIVLAGIKKVDKVAYIRFASVYREFVDITDFQAEIKKLVNQ
ncbi:MAG: transcriptional regulator NrdR [Patescibacteria group bacterium]|jgi:transcriptional repressor NrdR